jgi:uncharacterized protein
VGCSGTGSSLLSTEPPARSGGPRIRGSGATSLTFWASYAEAPKLGGRISPVRITLPDGEVASNDRADLEQILSRAFGRDIAFVEARAEGMDSGVAEEYWPDLAGLEYRDTVTDFEMPAGTFFDSAVVHLLTTSTIDRLRALYPQGRFEARRFRPNIVISTGSEDPGFVENDWIGRTVVIGDTVRLAITEPCPRCVMITLPQADLPKDSGILRTAAQHNAVNVGVYASVVNGGTVRRGDPVVFA